MDSAELIIPDNEHSLNSEARVVSHYPTLRFEHSYARQTLLRHFGVQTLAGFGCENKPLATRAAGAILSYLLDTQKGAIDQIQRLSTYSIEGFMALDVAILGAVMWRVMQIGAEVTSVGIVFFGIREVGVINEEA